MSNERRIVRFQRRSAKPVQLSLICNELFRGGTIVDINSFSTIRAQLCPWSAACPLFVEPEEMESNQRYYARRAAEERAAASRSMTAAAREWHAKLAQQFAARAAACCEATASAA